MPVSALRAGGTGGPCWNLHSYFLGKMSRFPQLQEVPELEIVVVHVAHIEDTFPHKAYLGAGVYRTEEGKPWVLPVVRKMEKIMAEDNSLDHEYLPILGLQEFCSAATSLVLGQDNPVLINGLAFGVQSISGTGALRVAAEFLCTKLGYTTVYLSDPTWECHQLLFQTAGFKDVRPYRYWKSTSRSLDLEGMLEDLNNSPDNSVIILQGCAHNPTGVDPTQEQWKKIAEVMKKKKLFPLFDLAYQGFASGDPDTDAWSIRHFVSEGFELLVAQSFGKNFGLYNERVGNLTFVVNRKECIPLIKSNVSIIIRAMYSNPPNHGARIVANILTNPTLREEWRECLKKMTSRGKEMRSLLRKKLEGLGTPGTWNHITDQIGMFSYTGLTLPQSEKLISKYHIYLLKTGRINVYGLNYGNVDYIVKAINDTIQEDLEKSGMYITKL